MTEPDVLAQVAEYLDLIFPEGGGGALWSQEPYKDDLFRIFAASYHTRRLHGDQVWEYLKDQWLPRKRLSEDDRNDVWDLCQAWSEWLYAWDRFPK